MGLLAASLTMSPLPTGEIAPQNQERRLLANALAVIQQSDLWPGRMLKIHVDIATQRLTVQVVNSETEEVLDQIPSQEALQMASELSGAAKISHDQANKQEGVRLEGIRGGTPRKLSTGIAGE